MEKVLKAVIYARFSSEKQNEASIEGSFGNVWIMLKEQG